MQNIMQLVGSNVRTIRYSKQLNMRIRNYFDLKDVYMFRMTDDKAFRNRLYEKILKRYYALILGEISKVKVIGYEFEDLKQEALIIAFQVIKKDYGLKSRSPFWYFLRLCIRRRLYSLIKSSRTRRNQAFVSARRFEDPVYNNSEVLEYTMDSILPIVESPENKVIEKIMLALMIKELKVNLSVLEYTAYFEKSLNNLTYKQIMDKYGFNSKSIDNAMSRVGKKLARLRSLAS